MSLISRLLYLYSSHYGALLWFSDSCIITHAIHMTMTTMGADLVMTQLRQMEM